MSYSGDGTEQFVGARAGAPPHFRLSFSPSPPASTSATFFQSALAVNQSLAARGGSMAARFGGAEGRDVWFGRGGGEGARKGGEAIVFAEEYVVRGSMYSC